MKKIMSLLLTLFITLILSGCATWDGVQEDSADAWDKTKEVTGEAWDKTKETVTGN